MASCTSRRSLVIIFTVAFCLNFVYFVVLTSKQTQNEKVSTPSEWGIPEDFLNISRKEDHNVQSELVSSLQETKEEKKKTPESRAYITTAFSTTSNNMAVSSNKGVLAKQTLAQNPLAKPSTQNSAESKKPKISNSLFFPRGVCGRFEYHHM